MALSHQTPTFDIGSLPLEFLKTLGFYIGIESLKRLWRLKLWKKPWNLRRNFGWFKIGSSMVSFLMMGKLEGFFSKVKMKPLAKLCSKIMFFNIKNGIDTFLELQPQVAYVIGKKYEEYQIRKNYEKLTGIKKEPGKFDTIFDIFSKS